MADLHYAAAQQNGTTSVTLSPAPSLDGHSGSPPEHTSTNGANHLSSSASCSSSAGSGGNHSDDSEYDSVGESPERSPVTQQSLSPPPLPQPQQLTNSVLGYTTSSSNLKSNGSSTTTSGQQSPSTNTNKSSSTFSHGASKMNSSPSSNEGGEYNNSKFTLPFHSRVSQKLKILIHAMILMSIHLFVLSRRSTLMGLSPATTK